MSAIETAADLDALPVGSVVLNAHGIAWQRLVSGWHSTNRPDQDSCTPWDLWYSMRRKKFGNFRTFVHDLDAIDERVRREGFRRVAHERRRVVWDLAVYAR